MKIILSIAVVLLVGAAIWYFGRPKSTTPTSGSGASKPTDRPSQN